MSSDSPEDPALSSNPIQPADSDAGEDASHVHLSFKLDQGVRLRITVETLPASGEAEQPNRPRTVFVSEPGGPDGEVVSVALPIPEIGPESAQLSSRLSARLSALTAALTSPGGIANLWAIAWRRARQAWRSASLEAILFGSALALYLVTRLVGLVDFPIYFFTDEAVQTVLAADLVRDDFSSYEKELLPTYFKNGSQYNLSLSVYLQVLPYLAFGKSVFVTRATSVLTTLVAAVCVGLILREFFKVPYWWSGTLLLSTTPAWLLHSRTAFETVLFTSLYASVLYAYLLYRYRSPRYLYHTLLLAALAFYSYSPGQLIVIVTAIGLGFSDARYHWQNRQLALRGIGLATLLALPYLRFRLAHPTALQDHLVNLGSYWIQPIPLDQKVSRFIFEYGRGLSPGYWFTPNDWDLVRHRFDHLAHLLPVTLPCIAIGLYLVLKEFRSSAHRAVLVALLATPSGAALAQIGITRALAFVVPAVLLAGLGVAWLLGWLEKLRIPRAALSLALFVSLATTNVVLLRNALVAGSTWFDDYGLGGMQYGARQLFGRLKTYLQDHPGQKILVTPTWSNGTDVVARFFMPDPLPFQMASVEGHLSQRLPLDDKTLFVLTLAEYQKVLNSSKFSKVTLEDTIPYPDGRTGFYFVRLRYVDDIDRIFAAEQEVRRQLLATRLPFMGQLVDVRYPHLDMGAVENAFDGDPNTLFRTLEANPAVLELSFPRPVQVSEIYLKFGSTEARLTVQLFPVEGAQPIVFRRVLYGSIEQPDGLLAFGSRQTIQKTRLEIQDTRQQEPGHVHVWEIELR